MQSFMDPTTTFVPKAAEQVAEKFGWVIYFVETHPSGETVVTFDTATRENEPHCLFELNLDSVQRMANRLGRAPNQSLDRQLQQMWDSL